MTERRKETRYVIPEIYQKYITFKIRRGSGEFISIDLLDFSLEGIKIRNPLILAVDSMLECSIAIPKSLTKELLFKATVKYCAPDPSGGDYLVGAEIVQAGDDLWLRIFSKAHDFINERIGGIF